MNFGPPGYAAQQASPPVASSAPLRAQIRAIAATLVEQLQQAQRWTSAWADQALADSLVEAALSECLLRLAETGCRGAANRLPSNDLWEIAGSWLEAGSLQFHARSKPHGYAGDYEMLTRIFHQSCCDHPLGRLFDRYFHRQAAPQAVRARMEQIGAALAAHVVRREGRACHAVSVGSGPGLDFRLALSILGCGGACGRAAPLRLTLLDVDPHALEVTRANVAPLLPSGAAIDCVHTNLPRLPQRSHPEKTLGTPDFLVCSGLFDYLDDEPAAAMLRLFWRQLAPGGLLLVGNFAPTNPTQTYMEWIGNWYLTYRTREQMERLAALAEIPGADFSLGCERTGADLFLIVGKPR